MTTQRPVTRIVPATRTVEGGGFIVNRPFPSAAVPQVDPFLLLDEMGPVELGPGEAVGAPDHPHRGFETVTYVLAGGVEHRDSAGHAGRIGPGDVQWMTAGAGVVHSEMPTEELLEGGGRMHGFQLWVNLPRRDKMMRPRYQEIAAKDIPRASSGDGLVEVTVIAGESLGARAAIDTRTPILYLHLRLAPGGSLAQPVPAGWNGFAYVIDGEARVAGRAVPARHAALLGDGDEVLLENRSGQPVELLLLAGAPLREPVVQYGPFVMNTRQEIVEAIRDYQTGAMGTI
jgi:redox-sensitive bicupin YhaK (pirin superfamily)